MATRIIEYSGIMRNDELQIVPKAVRVQAALTATATSAASAAVGSDCDFVCVQSDEAVYVDYGIAAPVATTNHYRLAAGGEQFFEMSAGDKVAIRT